MLSIFLDQKNLKRAVTKYSNPEYSWSMICYCLQVVVVFQSIIVLRLNIMSWPKIHCAGVEGNVERYKACSIAQAMELQISPQGLMLSNTQLSKSFLMYHILNGLMNASYY
jgi:hypothetical protein